MIGDPTQPTMVLKSKGEGLSLEMVTAFSQT